MKYRHRVIASMSCESYQIMIDIELEKSLSITQLKIPCILVSLLINQQCIALYRHV